MPEIPLEGYAIDTQRAQAMADAIDVVFQQADRVGPRPSDKLAALGIAAALVILRSKLAADPAKVIASLTEYIIAQVAALKATGPPR